MTQFHNCIAHCGFPVLCVTLFSYRLIFQLNFRSIWQFLQPRGADWLREDYVVRKRDFFLAPLAEKSRL